MGRCISWVSAAAAGRNALSLYRRETQPASFFFLAPLASPSFIQPPRSSAPIKSTPSNCKKSPDCTKAPVVVTSKILSPPFLYLYKLKLGWMLTSVKLAEVLSSAFPDLAGDNTILRKLLVVEVLPNDCSSHQLMTEYSTFGILLRAEIVRDDIGHRAGLLVFESIADCSAAAAAEPLHGGMRATRAHFLDTRNHRRSYRHLRNLIGVLDTVFPAATLDPNFLDRSLLMEGVSLRAIPGDLLDAFALSVQAEAAVVVRDAEFGDSVGLLVLTNSHDTEVVMAAGPRPRLFCDCIKASDSNYTRFRILAALDDRVRRQATAWFFRSLVPPEYLLADADMTFHLSCVFLSGPGCSVDGAVYNLCNIGAEVLHATGPINAVILGPDHDVAVLVYYDAQGTERIGRREPYLHLRQRQLMMYDSSLFPLPAGAAAEEASMIKSLLPPFIADADYHGRVIVLTEINTATCDAADIAWFIGPAGLEAVIVHRRHGVVFVVFQRQSHSELLLQVPQEEWFAAFKSPVELHLLDEAPMLLQQQQLAPVQQQQQQLDLSILSLGPRQWLNPKAFETVKLELNVKLAACPDHNIMELNAGLIGLAALSEPHTLRRSYFPDRAVLVTGTRSNTSQSDLRIALTRLLQEPAVAWMRLGLGDCRPAAATTADARDIADWVSQRLLLLHSMLPPPI